MSAPRAVEANEKDQSARRRFLLIAGANNGGNDRIRLRYATDDARAMSRVLQQLGGVSENDSVLLLDPTLDDFQRALAKAEIMLKAARNNSSRLELVFYYSGHSDERGLLLGGEHLSYRDLREQLTRLPANVRVAVLDSCASGAMTRDKGGRMRAPFLFDQSSNVTGHAYLTSASANEAAQESDRVGGSFFTHYLISGLRGAADANRDGRVTLSEAYQYAFAETLSRTQSTRSGPQHPNYDMQLAGSGDLVFTDLRSTSAMLSLSAELAGRFYIHDGRGHLVVEINKQRGRPMDLGLEPGTYFVNQEGRQAQINLERGGRQTLNLTMFMARAVEDTRARGSNVQDAAPSSQPSSAPTTQPTSTPNISSAAPTIQPSQLPAASSPSMRVVPFNFSFLPLLSVNGPNDRNIINHVAIGFPYSQMGELRGAAISLGANWAHQKAQGLQMSIAFNGTGTDFQGVQIGVGMNYVTGEARGVQSATTVNLTRGNFYGVQSTSGLNLVMGQILHGAQISAGVNWTGADMRGAQIAPLNISRELDGAQVGVLNIGQNIDGAQGGVLNIGQKIEGAQIGVLNIGQKIEGMQVGVVNIAEESDSPIGLLNFIRHGENHLGLSTSETSTIFLSGELGGKNTYSILGAGIHLPFSTDNFDEKKYYQFSVGLGARKKWNRLFLNAEILASNIYWNFDRLADNLLTSARLIVGYELHKYFAIYGGPTFNIFHNWRSGDSHHEDLSNLGTAATYTYRDGDYTMQMWPGLVIGCRL